MGSPARPRTSSTPDEDPTLVRRIRAGDTLALGDLYERHAPLLLAVGARILGSSREAEDLVHDVFIEAWSHVAEYAESRSSVRTWLLVRLRSRALDRRERLGRLSLTEKWKSLADSAPELRDSATPERLAVHEALARLDPDVVRALELSYFEGRSAGEIAELVGVPEGTVRSRLARGMRALAAILQGGPGDAP